MEFFCGYLLGLQDTKFSSFLEKEGFKLVV
jgi:hypothetical protein